ncbi:MAG: DUF1499 domain-containing protein [Halobacteriovoraceae bacterium]|nr:DUF1499 domain-containing protein [Halobacteriovoraceae bacterium]
MKYFFGFLLLVIIGLSVRFTLLGKESRKMTVELGVDGEGLKPCREESNCFHSDNSNAKMVQEEHLNESLISKIKGIALKEGLQLETESSHYLHFTDKSGIFGFVDDVEFYYHSETNKLHFRSASRVGKSDLGVNEKRMRSLLGQL